jgi:hypothetical protein
VFNEWLNDNRKLPKGYDLIALVGKDVQVKPGLDDMRDRLNYSTREELASDGGYGCFPPDLSAVAFLESTFKGFDVLRGVDVECYMEMGPDHGDLELYRSVLEQWSTNKTRMSYWRTK